MYCDVINNNKELQNPTNSKTEKTFSKGSKQ